MKYSSEEEREDHNNGVTFAGGKSHLSPPGEVGNDNNDHPEFGGEMSSVAGAAGYPTQPETQSSDPSSVKIFSAQAGGDTDPVEYPKDGSNDPPVYADTGTLDTGAVVDGGPCCSAVP
jgi:hypothetical protein